MSKMRMHRLAFLPKTLNEFASRWHILDEVKTQPGIQGALSHCPFHPSIGRSEIVTKNLATIRCSCDTFTFSRSFAWGWASCGIPQHEGYGSARRGV